MVARDVIKALLQLGFAGLVLSLLYQSYGYFTRHIAKRQFVRTHGCESPVRYPHRDPIFGLGEARDALKAAKAKRYLERIHSLYQQYGNTFASETLLNTSMIYTIEPKNIQTVLVTNFKDYHAGAHRKAAMSPLLGNSIVLTDEATWEHSRAMLRPSFSRSLVNDLPRFEHHTQDLIAAMPKDGTMVNLMELFFLLTADTTTDFMFGQSSSSLRDPGSRSTDFAKAFQDAQVGCEERWRLGWLANFVPHHKFWNSVKKVHAYMENHVQTALDFRRSLMASKQKTTMQYGEKENANEPYVLLKELAKLTNDKKTIQEGLLTIFFAGRDTTASLLTNMFLMLSKHPEIWNKLKEEVKCLDGRVPTIQDLNDLRYVRWCINESLRLHPIVAANSRIAIKDTILPLGGGPDAQFPVFVPKGTIVAFHVSALHRRQDLWSDDAEDFKPERWENTKHDWKYLPFIAGPRKCIGQQFALTEASYVTIRLAQEIESLESRDPGPWVEGLGVTCCSANGAKVSLTMQATKH